MRAFFIDFARSMNLDAFQPASWYNLPQKQLMQDKVAFPLSFVLVDIVLMGALEWK